MAAKSACLATLWLSLAVPAFCQRAVVHIVPNTHGTIGGWLVDFDTERNYVLNNYLEHLHLAARSPAYRFVWSEAPNLISLFELEPRQEPLLRELLRSGQVELVNAFWLESDVFLTQGETLAQLGIEGLRWYEQVFGLRPRFAWAIDITGAHRQLPQIVARLGLDAVVFTRNNPAARTAFWWRAPDGSRALAITAPHYMELRELFQAKDPASTGLMETLDQAIAARLAYSPSPRLALFIAGASDYSLPPVLGEEIGEFLRAWRARRPDVEIRFSTMAQYLEALRAEMNRGAWLPEYSGDTAFCFNGFWSNMPALKRAFRRAESLMHAAEWSAAAASLGCALPYPARTLQEARLLLLTSTDRNTLWGAGAGAVFRSSRHWDVWDRIGGAEQRLYQVLGQAAGSSSGSVLLSSWNWERSDPFEIRLPPGKTLARAECQADPSEPGAARCRLRLPAGQAAPAALTAGQPAAAVPAPVPAEIRTPYYTARIDPSTGEIAALFSASGRPVLASGAGRVQLDEPPEKIAKVTADFMAPAKFRKALPICKGPVAVRALRGPLATVLESSQECPEYRVEKRVWFYPHFPRIDFDITLELRRSDVLAAAVFPFAGRVDRRTRGIPFGFSEGPPEESWLEPQPYFLARSAEHNLFGYSAAVLPALGWSDYRLAGGGGLTLIEDGLPMHEFSPDRLTLGLVNAVSQYRGLPNEELRGLGRHRLRFALIPHEGEWRAVEAPKRAREFSAPPLWFEHGRPLPPLVRTSDNLILEALRRDQGDLEVRLVEWRGEPGMAWIECLVPHKSARRTNLLGEDPRPLARAPRYRFAVMPQEIVTLRFELGSRVETPPPLRTWAPLVPEAKRGGLQLRILEKGHPPRPF
jgi:alpha-mannosidase